MKTWIAAIANSLVAFAAPSALGKSFDLVIRNGRVMDPETSFYQVALLGIEDCEIVSITENDIIALSCS
ncbi:hypothetical protein [uncultured Roseibium sp.]|uniref:hypothetical protein n=1 Tax=uncultured Roseibium sp. TaxID=1936171 RepID=UPI0032168948